VAEKDYYSFDEVLENLKLEEDELKRLVSAGEIRAFRDKDTMRFKAEDIARLKADEGVEEEELALDDLELDLEDDLDLEPAPVAGTDVEETLVLEEPAGADEIVLEEEPGGEGGIEELDLGDAPAQPATAPGPRPARAKAAATPARRAGRATTAVATEEASDSVGMIAMLVVGILLLLIANFLIFDAVTGRASNPLSSAVANMFG
jgi:hypothetical protein